MRMNVYGVYTYSTCIVCVRFLVSHAAPSGPQTPNLVAAQRHPGPRSLAPPQEGLPGRPPAVRGVEREFFIDNLLVRIHFIIVMIRWTGLAPWEFESPFQGSLTQQTAGNPFEPASDPFRQRVWGQGFRVSALRLRGHLPSGVRPLGLRVIKKKKRSLGCRVWREGFRVSVCAPRGGVGLDPPLPSGVWVSELTNLLLLLL